MTTKMGVMYRREQDPSGLIQAARRAEELGFDQFWVVEDCFYMGGISQAAIALAVTSKIEVGIGINPAVAHNAAILAMEYSTLERAFPGRLIGGIGHGVPIWMEQIGEKVASPLTAIEETTSAMKRLLNGERITVDGRYVKLSDVQLDPPPAQAPPILHGVVQTKSLQLAGQVADGILIPESCGPDYIRWAIDEMNTHRAEPGYVGVYVHCLIDEKDPDSAVDTMRRYVAGAVGNELSPTTSRLSYADELQQLIDKGGPDSLYESMPDQWVRDLAVSGSVERGRQSIRQFVDAGADSVIFVPIDHGADWDNWLTSSAQLLQR